MTSQERIPRRQQPSSSDRQEADRQQRRAVTANTLPSRDGSIRASWNFVDVPATHVLEPGTSYPLVPLQRMKRKKQALITNYLTEDSPKKTTGLTLDDNPPAKFVKESIEISVDEARLSYSASLPGATGPDSGGYGHLDLFDDDSGGLWINYVSVPESVQKMGIGSKLVEKAIEDHGAIFASTSERDSDDPSDTRHLSVEGATLVASLIKKGKMKKEWLKDPHTEMEKEDSDD